MAIEELFLKICELGATGMCALALIMMAYARVKSQSTELVEAKAKLADAEATSMLIKQRETTQREIISQIATISDQLKQTTQVQQIILQQMQRLDAQNLERDNEMSEGFRALVAGIKTTFQALHAEMTTQGEQTQTAMDELRQRMATLQGSLEEKIQAVQADLATLVGQWEGHNDKLETHIAALVELTKTVDRVAVLVETIKQERATKTPTVNDEGKDKPDVR